MVAEGGAELRRETYYKAKAQGGVPPTPFPLSINGLKDKLV